MKDRDRTGVQSEWAVLVGVVLDAPTDPAQPLAELAGLASPAGARVVGQRTQRRERLGAEGQALRVEQDLFR
jgi:50S ribosomal subunit-associated GTPase HflX